MRPVAAPHRLPAIFSFRPGPVSPSRAPVPGYIIGAKSMIPRFFQWSRPAAIAYAAIVIAVIAITDWQVEINATLGFLYIFPMVLLGTALGWWQVILAAAFCTFLSDRL